MTTASEIVVRMGSFVEALDDVLEDDLVVEGIELAREFGIGDAVASALDLLADGITTLVGWLDELLEPLAQVEGLRGFFQLMKPLVDGLADFVGALPTTVAPLLDGVAALASGAGSSADGPVSTAISSVTDPMETAIDHGGSLLGAAEKLIGDALPTPEDVVALQASFAGLAETLREHQATARGEGAEE